MNFKKSKERTQILNECSKDNILESKTIFQCFDENMFTYGLESNEMYHEFTFICEDTLLRELSIIELLNLKRVKYFNHSVYLIDQLGRKEFSGDKIFNPMWNIQMN